MEGIGGPGGTMLSRLADAFGMEAPGRVPVKGRDLDCRILSVRSSDGRAAACGADGAAGGADSRTGVRASQETASRIPATAGTRKRVRRIYPPRAKVYPM